MTFEERKRAFVYLFEDLQDKIAPLKKETGKFERGIGYNNENLHPLLIGIVRQLDNIQNSYFERIVRANHTQVEAHLKEFEEAFYYAV